MRFALSSAIIALSFTAFAVSAVLSAPVTNGEVFEKRNEDIPQTPDTVGFINEYKKREEDTPDTVGFINEYKKREEDTPDTVGFINEYKKREEETAQTPDTVGFINEYK